MLPNSLRTVANSFHPVANSLHTLRNSFRPVPNSFRNDAIVVRDEVNVFGNGFIDVGNHWSDNDFEGNDDAAWSPARAPSALCRSRRRGST